MLTLTTKFIGLSSQSNAANPIGMFLTLVANVQQRRKLSTISRPIEKIGIRLNNMKTFISIVISLFLFAIAMMFGGGCNLSKKAQRDQSFKYCFETESVYHCKEYLRLTNYTAQELRGLFTAEEIKAFTAQRQRVNERIASIQQEENTAIEQYNSTSNK